MNEFIAAAADSAIRRSQLYHLQRDEGAKFAQYKDAIVIKQFNEGEEKQLKSLAMIDLSTFPRFGFKGMHTQQWLAERGVVLPEQPNKAVKQCDGSLVARLSEQEHLILSDFERHDTLAESLEASWSIQSDVMCYSLPRRDSHSWLYLSGEHVRSMLAKVCGIDLRATEFASGQIAQTSIARINSILIRDDLNSQITGFHLLCDSSSVIFVWQSLLDAMAEFDGKPVGLQALLESM